MVAMREVDRVPPDPLFNSDGNEGAHNNLLGCA
jgi:hypothetical protein